MAVTFVDKVIYALCVRNVTVRSPLCRKRTAGHREGVSPLKCLGAAAIVRCFRSAELSPI